MYKVDDADNSISKVEIKTFFWHGVQGKATSSRMDREEPRSVWGGAATIVEGPKKEKA
jgi:hypothetical protein